MRNNLPLNSVSGTGKHGIVLKSDVLSYVSSGGKSAPAKNNEHNTESAVNTSKGKTLEKKTTAGGSAAYDELPNSNIRKIIAQRLTVSKSTVPHGYMSKKIRIESLLALRASVNRTSVSIIHHTI